MQVEARAMMRNGSVLRDFCWDSAGASARLAGKLVKAFEVDRALGKKR